MVIIMIIMFKKCKNLLNNIKKVVQVLSSRIFQHKRYLKRQKFRQTIILYMIESSEIRIIFHNKTHLT